MLVTVGLLTILGSTMVLFVGVHALRFQQFRDLVLIAAVVLLSFVLVIRSGPEWWLVGDVVLLALSTVIGLLIGSTLRSHMAIITFCVVAGVVDVLSVSGGLTHAIVDSYRSGESSLLLYLTITAPVEDALRPIVGIGDLIIIAALFTGFSQLKHRGWMPFVVPVGGLILALAVGLVAGGVPALPFIGGATVVYAFLSFKTACSGAT